MSGRSRAPWRLVIAMEMQTRWYKIAVWLDELSPRWAGLAGLCGFLGAGLVVLRLPTWGFLGCWVGLLLLLVWLALSGKPVVKLVFAPEAEAVQGATESLPPPSPKPQRELLEMVELAGGEFWMGSPEDEKDRYAEEVRHRVRVNAMAMAKYPVTQAQYAKVMGENPSLYQGPAAVDERLEEWPVEQVSWFDAARFCNRLSEREGRVPCYRIREPAEGTPAQPKVEWDRAADGYRLATEAEWEYACRAGTNTAYSFGDDETQLGDHAWFRGNSDKVPHDVGEKKFNGWGLYDLHGNVWEWCWDWYEDYKVITDKDVGATLQDPAGPPSGSERVLRGGSFSSVPRDLRTAVRGRSEPEDRDRVIGFRCVRGSVRQP